MSNAFFLFFPAKWVWVWVHKAVLDLQSPSWWWGWGGEDIFPYSFAYFMIMFWWPPPPEPELKENIWPTYLVLCLTTEHTFTFYLLVLTLITHSPNSWWWWWWWSFSRWWCIRLPFPELVQQQHQQQQFLLLVSAGNLVWVCACVCFFRLIATCAECLVLLLCLSLFFGNWDWLSSVVVVALETLMVIAERCCSPLFVYTYHSLLYFLYGSSSSARHCRTLLLLIYRSNSFTLLKIFCLYHCFCRAAI